MIGARQWTLALAAGALAVGWAMAAQAQSNEVADYCQTSLKSGPAAKNFPDIEKFCGCVGEKVPAGDRAVTVMVMKASDEARAKGGRLDPATLPPEQAKALESLRKLVPSCMESAIAPPPPSGGKVTGLAAWNKLIGNTVAGLVDGKNYAEFYQPDGTVKTLADAELTTGKWSVEGEKVCFVYPKEDKACFTLELAGDDVTFTDDSGAGIRVKLLQGNPKNL
ncbi:MAG: hypothetical protein AB7O88_24440 [Reyranellaceae bacterium]